MSKMIIVKGCISCPFSCHTDDFDNYSGFKCTEIHSNIGWDEEKFVNMDDNFVDAKCSLPDYKEGGEEC